MRLSSMNADLAYQNEVIESEVISKELQKKFLIQKLRSKQEELEELSR